MSRVRVRGACLFHSHWHAPPELALSLVAVVGATPELNVFHRGGSPRRMRYHVMELEEGLLGTPAASVGHESTTSPVAAPDCAFDPGRHVSRAAGAALASARTLGGGELLLGHVLKERRQRSIEDLAEIPIRNLVA